MLPQREISLVRKWNPTKSQLKNDAVSFKEKVMADTKNQREANSKSADAQREQCVADLKSSISAAKEAYKVAKENLDSSYEEIYQQEFDKIAAKYANLDLRRNHLLLD